MYFSVQFMTKSKIHFLSIKHGRKLPTNGTSASTFSPNNGCTRAQIVTFLYRTMK